MAVELTPELERRLADAAAKAGRGADELAQDVIAGYLSELAGVRGMLDSRYDDLKSGKVKPIDGETFFDSLRQREEELLKPPGASVRKFWRRSALLLGFPSRDTDDPI